MTSSVYAEHPPPVQPSLLIGWSSYNSKSSKPNRSASSFGRRKKKTLAIFSSLVRASYPTTAIAGPCACCNPRRNPPPAGEDELVGAAPTEGNSTPTPTPVVSRAPTPAPATAPVTAPSSDNQLFKQFIKAYWEAQVLGHIEVDPKPCKQLSRLNSRIFTMVICTWTTINFASSVKITSNLPGPKGQTEFHLQLPLCVGWSPSNGSSTNDVATELWQWTRRSSRNSSERTSATPGLLLIAFGRR